MPYVARRSLTPFDAGVIGGGITGLVAARRLVENPRCRRVTLYEKSPRLGGWIQSETIPVDGGKVVFEYGPRTVRMSPPSDLTFCCTIRGLGLEKNILSTDTSSLAALNRYIYYPDRLVRIPTPVPGASKLDNIRELLSLVREPVFKDVVRSIICEPFQRRPSIYPDDESVADFLSRRFSNRVADNLASAMFRGIYAGDIDQLSAKSVLGELREREASEKSIFRGMIRRWRGGWTRYPTTSWLSAMSATSSKVDYDKIKGALGTASLVTWKNGLGEAVDALVAALKNSGKVDIITNTGVDEIRKTAGNSDITVKYGQGRARVHNRLIATNPAPDLTKIIGKPRGIDQPIFNDTVSSLSSLNYAVSVMVVNLYYSNPNLVRERGFGYLIPRSVPHEQNPEDALGVIFSSETGVGQDTAPGTKLTVMLGGYLWDNMEESNYPDNDQGIAMARSVLERHLGIKEAPVVARSRLQRNAIPQYTVNHHARLKEISRSVQKDFDHRLTLAGNWYGGVSIPQCIDQAHLATCFGIGEYAYEYGENYSGPTLEGGVFIPPEPWVTKGPRDLEDLV